MTRLKSSALGSSLRSIGRNPSVPPRVRVRAEGEDLDALPMTEVWVRYRATRTEALRNYLAEKYFQLVRYNAERIYARLPSEVDIQDLVSAGFFGLLDAIRAFDPDKGVKFETYCAPRIRGAILDELRSMDWVPRLVRHRTAKVEGMRQKIEMATGRPPTNAELASKMNLSPEEFDKLGKDSLVTGVISLNRRCYQGDSNKEVQEIDVIKDETQRNPFTEIQRRDVRELITKGLSRAERLIIILYYYEEMTMKEIGSTLDLSESRVSQMHSSILLRLKAQMQHRVKEFEPAQ